MIHGAVITGKYRYPNINNVDDDDDVLLNKIYTCLHRPLGPPLPPRPPLQAFRLLSHV